MKKVVLLKDIDLFINKLKSTKKKTVLVGGCFDILHKGHLVFLEKAKKQGDILIVLLESDENVKKLKGEKRPIHNQLERAKILSYIRHVDFVILLPQMKLSTDYAKLVNQIRPDVIAITKGDPYLKEKKEQAKKVEADFIQVTTRILNKSTTKLIKLIKATL